MSENQTAPKPANRPKFWRYWRERDMQLREVGDALGRSHEWVRLVSLPFDDPNRVTPGPEDVERVHRWSDGEITPADWYPPELSPAGPAAVPAEAAGAQP